MLALGFTVGAYDGKGGGIGVLPFKVASGVLFLQLSSCFVQFRRPSWTPASARFTLALWPLRSRAASERSRMCCSLAQDAKAGSLGAAEGEVSRTSMHSSIWGVNGNIFGRR